ncbi:DUF3566 domain-containing protein [Luteipulveratus mongoliensis]|nr:DUF3566 domain-containing protein [Luteipulveratus mongoliensis]
MSTPEGTEAAQAVTAEAPAARLPNSVARPTTKGPRPQNGAPATNGHAPAAGPRPAPRRPGRATPRRVRLTLSRVDPWSVMKIAFLLSVAAAIAGVVMVAVMWTVLQGMGVFGDVQDMFRTLDQEGSNFELMDYVGFGRVVSLSVVIGVIDIVLLTAIATLAAFLYNICASLVGGIQLTLSDE